ncbi:hypothetical protein CMI37_39355 [Candidatus Pacearchaeota archaeon]|nr:hypothetical protein [Candidatus Pacearchaeota archaeon]|tara:strand:+ start:1727 stop:2248 length:522 start_codon:yes stop_codon:yes gene_type:complete
MLKEIKAGENWIIENLHVGKVIVQADIDFLKNKMKNIKQVFIDVENKVTQTESKCNSKIAGMQTRVVEAETRERLNIKRQETFGNTQTQVEESRHKNIMEELKVMKEYNITTFNRSSYPFYPRYDRKKFSKGGKHQHFHKKGETLIRKEEGKSVKPQSGDKTKEHLNKHEKGQ